MINGLFLFCLALTALVVFRGWRRGLVGLVYGVGSWIFIAVFVTMANPPVYHYFMENEDIHDAVYERVYPYADSYVPQIAARVDVPVRLAGTSASPEDEEKIKQYLSNGGEVPDEYKGAVEQYLNGDTEGALDELEKKGVTVPEKYKETLDALEDSGVSASDILDGLQDKGIDLNDIAGAVGGSLKESAADIRKAAVEVAAERVTSYLLKAVAVVISYLLAKVICLLVKLALSVVTSVGPIRSVVRIAGAAVGAVEAALYIWIILYVISLTRLTEWGASLYGQVEGNPILLFLYENNGLASFLGNLL